MGDKNIAHLKHKDEPINLYRNIPGTNGLYQISREGDLRKMLDSGRVIDLKPYKKASQKTAA